MKKHPDEAQDKKLIKKMISELPKKKVKKTLKRRTISKDSY